MSSHEPGSSEPADPPEGRVDLSKGTSEAPFDPYRFGAPDVPPPPEYAPPGYVPPPGYQYPPTGAAPTAPPAYGPPPSDQPHGPFPPYPYGTTSGQNNPAPYGQPAPGQAPYGPPAYGPGPYGPPAYGPGPYGPPGGYEQETGNGKAVAGMVLGIVSIVMFWTTFFDAIFVVLGLVFSLLGLSASKTKGGSGRRQAVAGLACTAVGAVLAIAFTVFVVHIANECGGFDNNDSASYNNCIQDKL